MEISPLSFFEAAHEALQECGKLPAGIAACKLAVSSAEHRLMIEKGLFDVESLKKDKIEVTDKDIERIKSASERDASEFVMFPEMDEKSRKWAEAHREGTTIGTQDFLNTLERKAKAKDVVDPYIERNKETLELIKKRHEAEKSFSKEFIKA